MKKLIFAIFTLFTLCTLSLYAQQVDTGKRYFEVGEFTEVHNPAWGVEEDPWCINDHTFIYNVDTKRWHVIGITHSRNMDYIKDPGLNLLHISADHLFQTPWDIHPHALTANKEQYKETLLWAPHCIYHNGTYYMYVCAGAQEGAHFHEQYQMNLYTSTDLRSWSRYPGNPIFTDGFDARDAMVIKDGDQWIMYYTANSTPAGGNHIVAAYTSKDLIKWENRKVVFIHSREGTFGGPTESPFVVRRGDNYYLFVCDGGHMDVYLSNNPFCWKEENLITEIHDCRASEIIRDKDGKDYISSVGWFGGTYGLKIAPLKWMDGKDNESSSLTDGYIFERKKSSCKAVTKKNS